LMVIDGHWQSLAVIDDINDSDTNDNKCQRS